MLRLRRRRNFILAGVALALITYVALYQREDFMTRIMKPVQQQHGAPPSSSSSSIGSGTPVGDAAAKPSPTPEETVEAEDLLKEDPTPLIPSEDAAQKLVAEIPMSYGTASRPALFEDYLGKEHRGGVADLPRELLPGPGSGERRLVIVGDVHGQLSALESLLKKVGFKKATDHLILTGDMVAKGPDSSGVVRLAMELGASAVRGNHEDRVLLAHRREMEASSSPAAAEEKKGSSAGTTGPKPEPSPGTEAELAVAAVLSEAQLKWLASLPVILRLGPLPARSKRPWNAGTVAVVHAGLVPGVPLEKQDLRAAMNMRSLVYPAEGVRRDQVRKQLEEDLKAKIEKTSRGRKVQGHLDVKEEMVDAELKRLEKEVGFDRSVDRRVWFPVDGRDGEPWSEVWSRYMSEKKEEKDRTVVVYGHDAKAGLRVAGVEEETRPEGWKPDTTGKGKKRAERYAFGLDSGCVYGKQLTALVLEMGSDGGVGHRIVQVDCEKAADLKN